jgi:hypothetical protein
MVDRQRLRVMWARRGHMPKVIFASKYACQVVEPLWRAGHRTMFGDWTSLPGNTFTLAEPRQVFTRTYADMLAYVVKAHKPRLILGLAGVLAASNQSQLAVDVLLSCSLPPHKRAGVQLLNELTLRRTSIRHARATWAHPDGLGSDTSADLEARRQWLKGVGIHYSQSLIAMSPGLCESFLQEDEQVLATCAALFSAVRNWFYERSYVLIQCGIPQLVIKNILFHETPGMEYAFGDDRVWDEIERRARTRYRRKAQECQ